MGSSAFQEPSSLGPHRGSPAQWGEFGELGEATPHFSSPLTPFFSGRSLLGAILRETKGREVGRRAPAPHRGLGAASGALTCRRHASSRTPARSRHQSSPSSERRTCRMSAQRPTVRRRMKRPPMRTSTVWKTACPPPLGRCSSAGTRSQGGLVHSRKVHPTLGCPQNLEDSSDLLVESPPNTGSLLQRHPTWK